jgi:hypothetical protein
LSALLRNFFPDCARERRGSSEFVLSDFNDCGATSESFPLSFLFVAAAEALLVRSPDKRGAACQFLLKNSTIPKPACQQIVDLPD